MPAPCASAASPRSSASTYSSSRSKHSSHSSSGSAGPRSRLSVFLSVVSSMSSPLDRVERESPRSQVRAQLATGDVERLVEPAARAAAPFREHDDGHPVQRDRHERLALVPPPAGLGGLPR